MQYRAYQFPQTITRWRGDGSTDMAGRQGWTREVLKCRYENTTRLYAREDGSQFRSLAVIYTFKDDLNTGDMVALGEFTDERPNRSAYEVKQKRIITNMRGTRTEYRYIQ